MRSLGCLEVESRRDVCLGAFSYHYSFRYQYLVCGLDFVLIIAHLW